MPNRPNFSITVSTIAGWREISGWLAQMEAAAARVVGEVLVTERS
jgi:hypothetical protein